MLKRLKEWFNFPMALIENQKEVEALLESKIKEMDMAEKKKAPAKKKAPVKKTVAKKTVAKKTVAKKTSGGGKLQQAL